MHTKIDSCLQDANIASDIEKLQQRAHDVTENTDLIDDVTANIEQLIAAKDALSVMILDEPQIVSVRAEIEDVIFSLAACAREAVDRAESESRAAWNGPPVALVDAELHERRAAVLPKWWPTGSFDSAGDFSTVVTSAGGAHVTISPSSAWRIKAPGMHRIGVGLSLLRATILGEPHSTFVARAAVKLGISVCESLDDGTI